MIATEILDRTKKLVWPEIQKYLKDPVYPSAFLIPLKYQPEVDFYWQTVKEYPQRLGKYFRPTLVLLTAEAMGVKIEKAIKTAAAMQISEDFLLVHDDIEDDSILRRGKPTLHKIYGVNQAINAGDALHNFMWKVLWDNQRVLGAKKAYLLATEFYKMLVRTTLGQSVEIKWTEENKADFDDCDWEFVADGKISYYTIALPLRLGAMIAGAKPQQLELLAQFAIYLGRAFQLVDDLLDLTSDFLGLKQPLNDLYEGKRTVMLAHLFKNLSKREKIEILKILAKEREEKSEAEVKLIFEQMQKYGSIDYGWQMAREYSQKALAFFASDLGFLKHLSARSQLETIFRFVIERSY